MAAQGAVYPVMLGYKTLHKLNEQYRLNLGNHKYGGQTRLVAS
jgi:hypothetical protein